MLWVVNQSKVTTRRTASKEFSSGNEFFQNKEPVLLFMSSFVQKSPFLVNLVAENERIDEEIIYKIRHSDKRKQEIKTECKKTKIIVSALQEETNEVDRLRHERRKLLEEEKRLKAMIEIEKLNARKKDDRIKAERAEMKRKRMKTTNRQIMNKMLIEERKEKEIDLLRAKHNIIRFCS